VSRYSQLILAEPNLVSYWQLHDGGPYADLAGGNPLTAGGTLTNYMLGFPATMNASPPGPAGGSVLFNPGQMNTTGAPVNLQPAHVSVECWYFAGSSPTDLRALVCSNYYGSGGNIGYELGWDVTSGQVNNLQFGSYNTTTGWTAATMSGAGVINGQWNHVVGTYDGATLKLYVNGALKASQAWAGPLGYQAQPFAIGRYHTGAQLLGTFISDVAIYNQALTPAQIYNHSLAVNMGYHRTGNAAMNLVQNAPYPRSFLMVQSGDHTTPITGATVSVSLSKAGAAYAAAAGVITEIGNGMYSVSLTAVDTNTLGDLAYHCTAANADPTDFVDQVGAPLNFNLLSIDDMGMVTANNAGSGVAINAAWKFVTLTTMADPGNGKFRFNSASVTTTTQIAFSRLTMGNNDFSNNFRSLSVGDTIQAQESTVAANWVKFTLAGAPADNNTWWQLPVTYVTATGTLPSGNTEVSFLFTKAALDVNVVKMGGTTILQSSVYVGATPTTTDFDTNFTTDTGANSFIAQSVYFTSGVNAGRTFRINAYAFGAPTAGRVHLTVSTMPTAPANGDTFIVLGRIGN
jgi:hypothetical protein